LDSILNWSPDSNLQTYFESTCATEIKYKALSFYIIRIAFVILGSIYMSINTLFISKINRYESILTRQTNLEFVGTKPVKKLEKEEEFVEFYKTKLARTSNTFLWSKVGLLTFFYTVLAVVFWLQYGQFRTFILPDSDSCGGSHLVFNRPRKEYRCNFSSEWAIFLGTMFSDFLKVILAVLFFASVFFLFNYIRYGIDRIEKEHLMMNRFFTPGTEEFELDDIELKPATPSILKKEDMAIVLTPPEKHETTSKRLLSIEEVELTSKDEI